MPIELSAGVVVFRSLGETREYLLLRSTHGHWEFPKGHLQSGETWQQAAGRELVEEAGIIDATCIPGFSRQIQYYFHDRRKGLIHKAVAFVVAETKQTTASLSHEHTKSLFLSFDLALSKLTHAATRSLLRDAELFLKSSDDWSKTH